MVAWQTWGRSGGAVGTPSGVADALADLVASGGLLKALAVSWVTVLKGFGWAMAIGVLLGVPMGLSSRVRLWIEPVIDLLRSIAPFAWIPLALLWFGVSGNAGVMITAYGAFFPIVTNIITGVRRTPPTLVTAARGLGASRVRTFAKVIVPSALPMTLVGVRLGIGLAWASVVAAELATGSSTTADPGIGFLLYRSFALGSDSEAIVAMMVAIGVSALLADSVLRYLGRRLIVWPAP